MILKLAELKFKQYLSKRGRIDLSISDQSRRAPASPHPSSSSSFCLGAAAAIFLALVGGAIPDISGMLF